MQYTKLGNSDLMVSRICLGCMGFGDSEAGQHSWTIEEEQTREIIKNSLDKGINFFDTAIAYQNGTSEQYDVTREQDNQIIKRIEELAEKRNVTMSEIAIAWLLTKATSPVIGATKIKHAETATNAVDLQLSNEEIDYLEELYVPHALVGVIAQNQPVKTAQK